MFRKLSLLFLSVLCSLFSQSQNYIGSDFRFTFLKNLNPLFNEPPVYDIVIHALSDLTAVVEFGTPTDPYYQTQTISILQGEVGVVSFDDADFLYQETTDVVDTRSFFVSTNNAEARVYAFHNRIFFAESSAILPVSALGTDYFVMAYQGSNGNFPSLFGVVASENATEVDITPSANTPLGAAGTTYTVSLDAGEVMTISSSGDLTGTRITSNGNPIAVFGGHQQGLVGPPGCLNDSHFYEQLIPTSDWSTTFPIFPLENNGGDLYRILAATDGTEIFQGCDLLSTLNAGEVYEAFFQDPFVLNASEPVSVAAYLRGKECSGNDTGDPNMRLVLPLSRGNTNIALKVNNILADGIGPFAGPELDVVHLVMPTAETGDLLLNGAPVIGWQAFAELPDFSYVEVQIPPLDNLLTIVSASPFWAELLSLEGFDAFTMSIGSDSEIDVPSFENILVDLGPDQSLCEGENILLDPGLSVPVTWQDGSIQPTFTVTEPGIYSVTVDGACGNGEDEIEVSEGFLPTPELPDLFTICSGGGVTVEIEPEEDVTYNWSSGEAGAAITVSTIGEYSVTATSIDGCVSTATTEVNDGFILLELGPNQSLCPGETILLDPDVEGPLTWQDGSVQSTFLVSEPGIYVVSAETDCGTATDDIEISQGFLPTIELPNEISLCFGDEVDLSITQEPSVSYSWSNGASGPSITVQEFGPLTVIATSGDGCQSNGDTEVIDGATISVEIKAPELLCPETTETLTAIVEGDGVFLWDDGSTENAINISEPGEYSVVFTPANGCASQGTALIEPGSLPRVSVRDTALCQGDVLQLRARSPDGQVSWPELSESAVLEVSQAGVFEAMAVNECGEAFASAEVRFKDCSCPVFVPNAFTPNGDGLNDIFKPEVLCEPKEFELVIYNRWGEEVFYSDDNSVGWNGSGKRDEEFFSPASVYQYILKYDNPLRPLTSPKELKGTVTVIR